MEDVAAKLGEMQGKHLCGGRVIGGGEAMLATAGWWRSRKGGGGHGRWVFGGGDGGVGGLPAAAMEVGMV